MKNLILSFAFVCFISLFASAQDVITKTDASEIKAKVTEITDTEVKYKVWDNQEGPTYSIKKNDVFMIVYQNGIKESYTAKNETVTSPSGSTGFTYELYKQGASDARLNYFPTGTYLSTMLTGVLFPPAGLLTAVICAETPPKEHNLKADPDLMKNQAYKEGYYTVAVVKKSKNALYGTATGISIGVIISYLLLN